MIPPMPDCQGIENSRFLSNGGDFKLAIRFLVAFGISDLSNRCT